MLIADGCDNPLIPPLGHGSSAWASSSPPAGSRAISRTVSSPATVPRMEGQPAWSMTEAEELRGAGRGAQHHQVGARLGGPREPAARLAQSLGQPARPPRALRGRPGRPAAAGPGRPPSAVPLPAGRSASPPGRDPGRLAPRAAHTTAHRPARSRTAPSSSRSRESVVWVTRTPRFASRRPALPAIAPPAAPGCRRSAPAARPWSAG